MAPLTKHHTGGSLAEALAIRHAEGRPVRVGLIGAGQMGTDIIVQTALMSGIEVVARRPTRSPTTCLRRARSQAPAPANPC